MLTSPRMVGFSLLELMMALSFISILSALALPSYSRWIVKQRAEVDANTILRLLHTARSHTVQTGERISFCGADKHHRCVRDNIFYWQVFHDSNQNKRWDKGEELVQTALQKATRHTALRASGNATDLVFNIDGSARRFGSIYTCNRIKDYAILKRVSVNRSGRSYVVPNKKIRTSQIERFCT